MDSPIIGGVLAFLGGALVSALNFTINLRTLKKNPSALTNVAFLRQVLSVGYLAGVFFLSKVLPWDYMPMLLGAALGLTIPSIFLAFRLAKINDNLSSGKDASSGKGAESDE